MVLHIRAVFSAALVQVIICGTVAVGADIHPTPRALGREFIAASAMAAADSQAHKGDLNLHQALMMSLQHNPELASSSWEVKSREAEAVQAGLRPNPELDLEVEGFAGSGEFSDFDAAETTLTFSQLIELGRKRDRRKASAALQQVLAGWDYEAKRLDVVTETAKAATALWDAQALKLKSSARTRLLMRSFRSLRKQLIPGLKAMEKFTSRKLNKLYGSVLASVANLQCNANRFVISILQNHNGQFSLAKSVELAIFFRNLRKHSLEMR